MNKIIWTDNEIKIINENYNKLTIREIQKLIPEKEYRQIKNKIIKMGYNFKKEEHSRQLTDTDVDFILNNYKIMSIQDLAIKLNVSRYAIKNEFEKLNIKSLTYGQLKKNKLIYSFSNDDINYINMNINKLTLNEIAEKLNRPYLELFKFCKFKKICFKSRQEILNDKYFELDKKIIEIGNGKSIKYISKKLNEDYNLIFRRLQKLDINYINDYPKWSQKEKKQLLNLYKTTTLDDLSLILHRTKISIINNAKKMNINLLKNSYVDNVKLTDENYQYLVDNFKEETLLKVCNTLNINVRSTILKVYLSRIYDFNLKGTFSLLELIVAKILDEHNIRYESQFKIKLDKSYILCDFKICDTNKIIEVYGDFWHGKDIQNKKNDPRNLEKIRKRDIKRENIIKSNNFELLIIWESDILNNLQYVYKQIRNYIK